MRNLPKVFLNISSTVLNFKMKSDVATDLIRHVIDSIIDNISNKIVDENIINKN